jgi:hypothetical protein
MSTGIRCKSIGWQARCSFLVRLTSIVNDYVALDIAYCTGRRKDTMSSPMKPDEVSRRL